MNGYTGQVLCIDLSRGTTESLPLAANICRAFLGGNGLGAHLLSHMMPPRASALAPESMLGFVSGALTGSGALLTGRYSVVCQSPLTNSWYASSAGGGFGPMLRAAGYDAVLISGASSQPVYVYLHAGQAHIYAAAHLWGRTIPDAAAAMRAETNPDCCYSLIGPAGERQDRSACIINESGSSAGQGCGAVMGAKNLKAFVVQGSKPLTLADPPAIQALNQRHLTGDPCAGEGFSAPHYACFACPVQCGAHLPNHHKATAKKEKKKLKAGIVHSFNSLFAEPDKEAVQFCQDLCNAYGLDIRAVADSIFWFRQCAENGLFSAAELARIDASWGQETILQLSQEIAEGQGCGAVLAQGTDYAAAYWRRGQQFLTPATAAKDIAPEQLAAWLAQAEKDAALCLEDGIGKTIKAALRDACGFCKLDRFHLSVENWLAYLNAATGWAMDQQEFIRAGARIYQMGRVFYLKQNGQEKEAASLLNETFAPAGKIG